MLTGVAAELPILAESSTARARRFTVPLVPPGVQAYVQDEVPVARCHVRPPSVETSTTQRTPPPASVAVPLMVTATPPVRFELAAGEVMTHAGGVVSVDCVAATRPA